MNTQTEILTKRTCERVKIGVDERQRICLFKMLEIMSILGLLRKFDAALIPHNQGKNANRSITDILVSDYPAD